MKNPCSLNDVSILVVTHNHSDFIQKLLNSLESFNYTNAYFCDAASKDGTKEILLKSVFAENLLLKNKLEGFSKNNNDLIRYFELDTPYFLLLNPDTYFDMDFISILLNEICKSKEIGIISPLLKYPNGNIQVTWKRFPSIITVIRKRLGILKATDEFQMPGPLIDWCLGACMLITHDMLGSDKTLLDERYRLYCEDIDICFSARQKKLKVIGSTKAYIYHSLNERSSRNIFSKYNWWNLKSILQFILKWNISFIFRKRNTS